MERTETTYAFNKYIDVVFILQNNLMGYAPRKYRATTGMSEYVLEDYNNELELRAGMCLFLANKIENMLSFSLTKERFKKEMHKVASNWDIDAAKAKEKENNLNATLLTQAKITYCLNNHLNEVVFTRDTRLLACLMSFYAKIVKTKKEKQIFQNIPEVSRTKFYRYVKEVCLEENNLDIKKYSQKSLKELGDLLFDLIAEYRYRIDNFVEEPLLTSDGETDVLEVFVDDGNNDYQTFKKEFEDEVYDWLIEEMHKQENNFQY